MAGLSVGFCCTAVLDFLTPPGIHLFNGNEVVCLCALLYMYMHNGFLKLRTLHIEIHLYHLSGICGLDPQKAELC